MKYLLIGLLLLAACTQSVEEITSDDSYINEDVKVSGVAESSLKIGSISGYTLVDDNGDKIFVGSESLPAEGEKITASGTLKKGLLGYYIDTKN